MIIATAYFKAIMGLILFSCALFMTIGCSDWGNQNGKDLPPVSKDVKFTPSETLKVPPLGVQKK